MLPCTSSGSVKGNAASSSTDILLIRSINVNIFLV